MKKLILITLALVLLCSMVLSAQLIQSVSLQDGTEVSKNYILRKNDTCTFISNEKLNWEFRMFASGNFYDIVLDAADTDTFQIPIIREKFTYWTVAFEHVVPDNDSLEYLIGEVRAVSKDSIVEVFPIMLDVLPVRPRIESITWDSITLNPDDAYCIIEPAHIMVFCGNRGDNSERFGMFEIAWGDYFGGETSIRWNDRIHSSQFDYEHNNEFITFDFLLDWASYIRVSVNNEFGTIYSNPALVNDYITDPYVLSIIEEYRHKLTGIGDKTYDDNMISISTSNNSVKITDEYRNISMIRIVDSTGKTIIIPSNNPEEINMSSYPTGIYIIVCQTKDNNIVSHKFIKR